MCCEVHFARWYTYTASGDLATRTDARGIATTFAYDGLHRVQTKSYTGDGRYTPNVTYAYYGAGSSAGSVGQLQSMTSSAATVSYGYDVLGRMQSNTQATNGNAYSFQYSYLLHDGLSSMQNPSGKIVNDSVDDAGRTIKVSTATKTYADLTVTGTPYAADGRIVQMKLGNDLWETHDYQTPGTANNGNLYSHVIRQGSHTWTQSYS